MEPDQLNTCGGGGFCRRRRWILPSSVGWLPAAAADRRQPQKKGGGEICAYFRTPIPLLAEEIPHLGNFCGGWLPAAADGRVHRPWHVQVAQQPGSPKARKLGGSPPMASGERRRSTHGERSEAPTAAGASSSRIQQLSFSCAVVFAAVAYRRQRRGQNPPMCW